MTGLTAGEPFPQTDLARVGGGAITLGVPRDGHDWQLVVIYRGLHCPICKKYLAQLDGMKHDFAAEGVDIVVASGDPLAKAEEMSRHHAPSLSMAFGMSVAQMRALGLYISDPRSPRETDRPFPEPGLFVINPAGLLQMIDISNAPFLRPDIDRVLSGISFVRENEYPIRGTHEAA